MRILNWNANGPRAARRKGSEMSIGSGASQASAHQSMHPEWTSSSTTWAGTPMGPIGPLRRGRSNFRWDSVGNGRPWRCCWCSGWTSRSRTTDSRRAARFRAPRLVCSSSDSVSWGVGDVASELRASILGLGVQILLHGGDSTRRCPGPGRYGLIQPVLSIPSCRPVRSFRRSSRGACDRILRHDHGERLPRDASAGRGARRRGHPSRHPEPGFLRGTDRPRDHPPLPADRALAETWSKNSWTEGFDSCWR